MSNSGGHATDTSTRYVFSTDETIRYRFPTHTNLLIMDRAESATSEAFWVVLEPGEAPPLHVHPDAEQLFFVFEGAAVLRIGPDGSTMMDVESGDLVRIPPGTYHSVKAAGNARVVYLSIDCFVGGRPATEPTWESHVRVLCAGNGWSFEGVREGPSSAP